MSMMLFTANSSTISLAVLSSLVTSQIFKFDYLYLEASMVLFFYQSSVCRFGMQNSKAGCERIFRFRLRKL